MNLRTSERLNIGDIYTREDLRRMFTIRDATLMTGILRPKDSDSIWLFITEDKTPDRTQYKDKLDGDILSMQGQTTGRTDHWITDSDGLELLLYYRNSKSQFGKGAGFRYEGEFEYVTLTYSTYLGGSNGTGRDAANGIAVDSSGNAYVTGYTGSTNFPTSFGAFQSSYNGGTADAFVAKLNPAGTALVYSTYLGGSAADQALGIAVDSSGNAYVTGGTGSTNFPTTAGAFQASNGGGLDAFVTELNPAGDALVYSTYLGASGTDVARHIGVDSSGNAYITGYTTSTNFPTTAGAFQTSLGGSGAQNAFVAKLNPAGTALVYSTYLGGNNFDEANGIAIDSSGNAYITGLTQSTNFPTTAGAFQTIYGGTGSYEAFVTRLNPAGAALDYSTYLGGSNYDEAFGIAIDSSGDAYVTGYTGSANLPTTAGAFQTSLGGTQNAFVTKLNPAGAALVYSTYLGGSSFDYAFGIAVDSSGNAYVTGVTGSTNFPTTAGAFQTTFGGDDDAFVTKLNPAGAALVYSTYLGGINYDSANGIAVDSSGNAYVTGFTTSTNFPTTAGAFQAGNGGGLDAFVAELNPAGAALVYSTYLGGNGADVANGIALDSSGNAYITGYSQSTNFPTTAGAFQTSLAGAQNAFVANFSFPTSTTTGLTSSPSGSTGGQTVTFTATVTPAPTYATGLGSVTFKATNNSSVTTTIGTVGFLTAYDGVLSLKDPSLLPSGSPYNVVAYYSGSTDLAGSTSNTVVQTVNPEPTATTISAPMTSTFGQSVMLTATVSTSNGATPAGSVTFKYGTGGGAVSLGNGTLTKSGMGMASASLTTSALPAGMNNVTANYTGSDLLEASSSSAAVVTVASATSTTSLANVPSTSVYGQVITLTATITPEDGGEASGTVTFTKGAVSIGVVSVSGNKAVLPVSHSEVGSYVFGASYTASKNVNGVPNVSGSAATPVTQTVGKASTTTVAMSSPSTSTYGQTVTLTATVSTTAPGVGVPTGAVAFYNNCSGTKVEVGVGNLSGGMATLNISTLPVGSNMLCADYTGSSEENGSPSPTITQTVDP